MIEIWLEVGFAQSIDAAAAAAASTCRFLRHAWFESGKEEEAFTLLGARSGGQIVAALPTSRIGPRWLGLRAVPGCYWPFRSFPVAEDLSDEELADFLCSPEARRSLGRVWRLGPVPADDPAAARLFRVASRCGYSVLTRSAGTAFVLNIGRDDWPRPSTLRNLHKHEKKLAKLGTLEWRFVGGSGWTAQAFEDLRRIERSSWAGRRADADTKFLDPALDWETIVKDPVLAGMLSVGILSIGGEPVAFSFGLDCGNTRYSIATSYDERFARHSAGYFTNYRTYIHAAERGIKRLNLGAGDGGEKTSMGAVPSAELMDYLFVGGGVSALLLRPFWRS